MDNYIIINCPHCNEYIFIYRNEINCAIFRHGIIKESFNQINPHAPKQQCDEYINNNQIYGCGKPFRIVNDKAVICEYI